MVRGEDDEIQITGLQVHNCSRLINDMHFYSFPLFSDLFHRFIILLVDADADRHLKNGSDRSVEQVIPSGQPAITDKWIN